MFPRIDWNGMWVPELHPAPRFSPVILAASGLPTVLPQLSAVHPGPSSKHRLRSHKCIPKPKGHILRFSAWGGVIAQPHGPNSSWAPFPRAPRHLLGCWGSLIIPLQILHGQVLYHGIKSSVFHTLYGVSILTQRSLIAHPSLSVEFRRSHSQLHQIAVSPSGWPGALRQVEPPSLATQGT